MKYTPNLALPYPEPSDNTQTWVYWQQLAERLDLVCPKYACGAAPANFSNVAYAAAVITYPVGLFAVAPYVAATLVVQTTYFGTVVTGTAAGVTVGVRHYKDTLSTGVVTVQWVAFAAKPTTLMTARAVQAAQPETFTDGGSTYSLRPVTCHTQGCGNAGKPVEVYVPDKDPQVICGVCGQPITDIA